MSILYDPPIPFVGVGPGRCGTNSLARILNECRNVVAKHEGCQVPWYDSGHENLGNLIRLMREMHDDGKAFGDINLALITHVGELRSSIRNLNVVCLHRPKDEVVRSFVNFGAHKIRPGDKAKWGDKCYGDNAFRRSAHAFPIIDAATAEQAYGFYWEYYETLMGKIQAPVMHIQTQDLNDDTKLTDVFDFLSIPEVDRVYPERRVWNSSEYVDKYKRWLSAGSA